MLTLLLVYAALLLAWSALPRLRTSRAAAAEPDEAADAPRAGEHARRRRPARAAAAATALWR